MAATVPQLRLTGAPSARTCDLGSAGATAYATGRLMGTDCQVRATCTTAREALAAVGLGWQGVQECERLWSRFRPDSELSQLNSVVVKDASASQVSELTATLIAAMLWAYEYSDGWVDASLLPEVIAAGYDRDFADVAAARGVNPGPGAMEVPQPRHGGVRLTARGPGMKSVSLEGTQLLRTSSVQLDSGGVGKGLAADLVAESIVRGGAIGALVDLGGDIRAIGVDQHARPWTVRAADERDPRHGDIAEWDVNDAGVATSSVARRRWNGGHHLIDPHTGKPSESDLCAVTVVHRNALAAEVAAKTALLMGRAAGTSWLDEQGVAAVLTGRDGTLQFVG